MFEAGREEERARLLAILERDAALIGPHGRELVACWRREMGAPDDPPTSPDLGPLDNVEGHRGIPLAPEAVGPTTERPGRA